MSDLFGGITSTCCSQGCVIMALRSYIRQLKPCNVPQPCNISQQAHTRHMAQIYCLKHQVVPFPVAQSLLATSDCKPIERCSLLLFLIHNYCRAVTADYIHALLNLVSSPFLRCACAALTLDTLYGIYVALPAIAKCAVEFHSSTS